MNIEIDVDLSIFRDTYLKDGVVLVKNVLTPDWLDRLREAVDAETAKGKRYFAYRDVRLHDGAFKDFCLHSSIGRRVAQIAGTNRVSLLFDALFVKEPGTKTRTGWHTDQPYWPVKGPIMTTWIALDPVTRDNGAMEFIRGSHAWGVMYRPFRTDQNGDFVEYLKKDNPIYTDPPDFEAERDKYEILSWEMQPGDMLAFDGNIAHAARGNQSATLRRRGYAVRFATEGATYQSDQGVADWMVDTRLATGDPMVSEKFPVIYEAS